MMMREGLLWFDNNPAKGLSEKVREAAAVYRRKFGVPDCCMVSPLMLVDGESFTVDGVSVFARRVIAPGHLWIGKAIKDDDV